MTKNEAIALLDAVPSGELLKRSHVFDTEPFSVCNRGEDFAAMREGLDAYADEGKNGQLTPVCEYMVHCTVDNVAVDTVKRDAIIDEMATAESAS